MQRLKKLIERYTIVPESISNRITMEFQLCQGIAGIDRWATKLSQIPFDLPKDRLERQIKSYFFELDVMAKLYQSEDVQSMTYEPKPLSEGGKNCDLMVETGESNYLFEIKCFNPENKSRELHTQYFPKHISVDIDTRVYYDDFTIRSDLIQRAFEVEEKFENYAPNIRAVMVIPTGYYLDLLRLYGFVYVYRYGRASPLDYLGPMTLYHLKEKGIVYQGLIDEFWSCHEGWEGIDEVSLIDASKCQKQPIAIKL